MQHTARRHGGGQAVLHGHHQFSRTFAMTLTSSSPTPRSASWKRKRPSGPSRDSRRWQPARAPLYVAASWSPLSPRRRIRRGAYVDTSGTSWRASWERTEPVKCPANAHSLLKVHGCRHKAKSCSWSQAGAGPSSEDVIASTTGAPQKTCGTRWNTCGRRPKLAIAPARLAIIPRLTKRKACRCTSSMSSR